MMTTLKKNVSVEPKQESKPESGSHLQMHREHNAWLSDIKTWEEDLVEWQAELRRLSGELKEFVSMVEAHDRALVAHSEAISLHHQMLAKHEHKLSKVEQGGTGEELIGCSCEHQQELERHAQQKISHESTKQLQRTLISQWEHLHKAVSKLPKA